MRLRYVLLSGRHVLGADGGHHEKRTVGRRSQDVLHGSDPSDGVDIAEAL